MDPVLMVQAIAHAIVGKARWLTHTPGDDERRDRDRGAVSLEQVLWFAAAGVAVAVIAAIIWAKVKREANTPVRRPGAP